MTEDNMDLTPEEIDEIYEKTPPGFLIYKDTMKMLLMLSDQECGRTMKAFLHQYLFGSDTIDLDDFTINERLCLEELQEKQDADKQKYINRCIRNTQNSRKRRIQKASPK